MVATIMHSSRVSHEAELILGRLGVTRLLPELWEMVHFEMQHDPSGQTWDKMRIAQRYLSYLRDRVRMSTMDPDRGSEYGVSSL